MDFFITSQGRTGTMWLAWLLNQSPTWLVEHEPKHGMPPPKERYGICSPADLHDTMKISANRKGVILRDPREVALSVSNIFHKGRFQRWAMIEAPLYYGYLEELLSLGVARRIDYARFGDIDYLNRICEWVGIDDLTITQEMVDHRENTMEIIFVSYDDIPDVMKKMVDEIAMPFFEKWYPIPDGELFD